MNFTPNVRISSLLFRVVALAAFSAVLSTEVASACEYCKTRSFWWGFANWCAPVPPDGSLGVTNCYDQGTTPSLACTEKGNVCSEITVDGGGTGGSGGGGGGNCGGGAGGCPAECFSCGGGGLYI